MKALLSGILSSIPTLFITAQSISGDWNGNLNTGGTSLPLVLHITSQNGENQCLLDSPDQGAKGIPATLDFLSADSIALRVPAIGASYAGKLKNGQITGYFIQAGMKFALTLKPGDYVRQRAQTPQAPLPYQTEEVTFENPADHTLLSGTLSYPMAFSMQKEVPVVLLVTGSGQQNRDEEIMGHKPFAVIADYLAKMGIASLRYDDRGFGKSTGDLTNATTHTFMTDALAGIRYLKSTGKFSKTGILGHSEGGLIAFMAAQEKPEEVDFIVSMAGTALKGDEILVKQNERLFSANPATAPISEDYCKVLKKVFAHLVEAKPVDKPIDIVEQYTREVGANLPAAAKQNLQTVLVGSNPWLNYFLSYDPAEAISKTVCPVMAINGEKDTQVDAAMNLGNLRKILPSNEKHLIQSYPELNHLFQHCSTGLVNEYAAIEETFSPEVLSDIARWINAIK